MEQTQNSFVAGLQMDTHPMQQGQNSLTDALNATFVTMNGNEIVLQNDMGNARVQNAYLPKGYVPVGMKEYGGVIYVASYNPITDRGQIGSFPSPKRRFFNLSKNESPASINLCTDFVDGGLINRRSILTPIGEDNILRAGDKFILYFQDFNSENLQNLKTYISNWDQTDERNRLFTLSAGVLNSKSEFVDITKNLIRFDDSGNIISTDGLSEFEKFNKGYFISPSITNSNLPESDSEINEVRALDKLPLNTYAFKLVGPLYIKTTINIPEDFDYSIIGYKTSENQYKFHISAVVKYNGPNDICLLINDNYYSDLENDDKSENEKVGDYYYKYFDFDIENITSEDGIYNYTITPAIKVPFCCQDEENCNYYGIKDLMRSGSIDLTKLGSGEMELNSWRFYNNLEDQETSLLFGFDSYPKLDHEFQDLTFTFYKIDENSKLSDIKKNSEGYYLENVEKLSQSYTISQEASYGYNGIQDIVLSWEDFGITERSLYQVLVQWKDIDLKNKTFEYDYDVRWLLTTPLFNDSYFQYKQNFINDFCNPSTEYEQEVYNELTSIKLDVSYNSSAKETLKSSDDEFEPYKQTESDELTKVSEENSYDVNLYSHIEFSWNEEYYPSFITLKNPPKVEIKYNNVNISNNGISIFNKPLFDKNYTNIKFIENKTDTQTSSSFNNLIVDFKDTRQCKLYDYGIGKYSQEITSSYKYRFKKLSEILDDYDNFQASFNPIIADKRKISTIGGLQASCSNTGEFLWRDNIGAETIIELKNYVGHIRGGSYNTSDTRFIGEQDDGEDNSKIIRLNDQDIYQGVKEYLNKVAYDKFMVQGVSVFKSSDEELNTRTIYEVYTPYLVCWIKTKGKNSNDPEWTYLGKKPLSTFDDTLIFDKNDNYIINIKSVHKQHPKFVVNTRKNRTADQFPINSYKDWINEDPDKLIMVDGSKSSGTSSSLFAFNPEAYNNPYTATLQYKYKISYE